MTVAESLSRNNILLVTTLKKNYMASIGTMQSELSTSVKKIGYITINKPYNNLLLDLAKRNIDKKKFYFVDAITATAMAPPIVTDCLFVASPSALTDIGMAFSSLLSEKNCDLVFFDTISTLMVYEDIGSVIKFVHNLVTKARVTGKKVVFMSLTEDSEALIKDLNMFVDEVIEI
ncbi:MAG: hypothetical protein HGA85_04840 [Nanoarchaeota archaeon]|nr:hypothetical protein [Nanoarchaeota archaeon]